MYTSQVVDAVVPGHYRTAHRMDATECWFVEAGLLLGIGDRYASGCTSGQGVCGLSRLSPRSFVATLTFMGAGFVMVYVLRHIL